MSHADINIIQHVQDAKEGKRIWDGQTYTSTFIYIVKIIYKTVKRQLV